MIRNTVEVTLYEGTKEEIKVGFRTGTYAWGLAIRQSGAMDNENFIMRLAVGDLTASVAIFYGSYVQYQEWKGLKPELNMVQVSELLEDMKEGDAQRVMDKLLEAYLPKNLQPSQKAGEKNDKQQSTTGNTSLLQKQA